ncbi:MAG: nitrate reductase [Hyphomicrobiales bacterium]|nr:MAG: nitrate reductase [Hyphomicrobiales bacterium]
MSQVQASVKATEVKTTCPYCGVGCGLIATIKNNKDKAGGCDISVKGDETHPANKGVLCSKGMALAETLDHKDRLLHPVVDGQQVSWDDALNTVANGLRDTIEKHGPDSVAFYVSGQFLTEDYYVANKLMKGFIGSGNIDTNSRLCMSSSVAGHKRAFGADIVPGNYDDWEQCDLAVLVGSNAAWCHPILFNRLLKAQKERGAKIVIIDPRHTASCEMADMHLPLLPGSDVALFNGLLCYLSQHKAINAKYVETQTNGMTDALESARADVPNLETVAQKTGLTVEKIEEFYGLFLKNERALTIYSQGVNQSSSGTDKVNAIINCHLFTGRISKPGMGPFSVTGQPNAMGGREVGGLANMLAAHMDFTPEAIDLVSRFWGSDNVATKPGAKAVDMFDKIDKGEIKAVWIMATNPAVSMPNANKVRRALANCPLVIVSDCMDNTDSMKYANVKLPAMAWGEKNGTVTNSERRISRQRSFLKPAGAAKADWWIMTQVAKKMGFDQHFNYSKPVDVYREHAQLSTFENRYGNGKDADFLTRRAFTIGLHAHIIEHEYDGMPPLQWPLTDCTPYGMARMPNRGEFFNQNRKANFVAIRHKAPENKLERKYPLVLNSGRIRDQWHTMSRTGKSAKLNNQHAEPFVHISPQDAAKFNIQDSGFVEINSKWGQALVRAHVEDKQVSGQIFMPMHWTDVYTSKGVIGALVNPAIDAISGQPELKHTPIRITAWTPDWHGYFISDEKIDSAMLEADENIEYWAYNYQEGCHILNLAGGGACEDVKLVEQLKMRSGDKLLSYVDDMAGQYRYASTKDDKLESCFMIAKKGNLPPREWVAQLISKQVDISNKTGFILSGVGQDNAPNLGPIVCACMGVYQQQIIEAINEHDLKTVEQVGELLQAGTNCGSCISEIKQLL